jgi:hypothetical protein
MPFSSRSWHSGTCAKADVRVSEKDETHWLMAGTPIAQELLTCRNSKTLFFFDLHVSELENGDVSLQFVRKLCDFNVPSKANKAAFDRAVGGSLSDCQHTDKELAANAASRNLEVEVDKAKAASLVRFGR